MLLWHMPFLSPTCTYIMVWRIEEASVTIEGGI
jgi:hypothetical protein